MRVFVCFFANFFHPYLLWYNFCGKGLIHKHSDTYVEYSRYKRWLNQKRFVFIHIENLTNQHNFTSSSFSPPLFSSFKGEFFLCLFLWHMKKKRSFPSHYCVCIHQKRYLWFWNFSLVFYFIIFGIKTLQTPQKSCWRNDGKDFLW